MLKSVPTKVGGDQNIYNRIQWKKKVKSHLLTLYRKSVFRCNIVRKMTPENVT